MLFWATSDQKRQIFQKKFGEFSVQAENNKLKKLEQTIIVQERQVVVGGSEQWMANVTQHRWQLTTHSGHQSMYHIHVLISEWWFDHLIRIHFILKEKTDIVSFLKKLSCSWISISSYCHVFLEFVILLNNNFKIL